MRSDVKGTTQAELKWNAGYLESQKKRILLHRFRTKADVPDFIDTAEIETLLASMFKRIGAEVTPHKPPELLTESELKVLYPNEPYPLGQCRLHVLQQASVSGKLNQR